MPLVKENGELRLRLEVEKEQHRKNTRSATEQLAHHESLCEDVTTLNADLLEEKKRIEADSLAQTGKIEVLVSSNRQLVGLVSELQQIIKHKPHQAVRSAIPTSVAANSVRQPAEGKSQDQRQATMPGTKQEIAQLERECQKKRAAIEEKYDAC